MSGRQGFPRIATGRASRGSRRAGGALGCAAGIGRPPPRQPARLAPVTSTTASPSPTLLMPRCVLRRRARDGDEPGVSVGLRAPRVAYVLRARAPDAFSAVRASRQRAGDCRLPMRAACSTSRGWVARPPAAGDRLRRSWRPAIRAPSGTLIDKRRMCVRRFGRQSDIGHDRSFAPSALLVSRPR